MKYLILIFLLFSTHAWAQHQELIVRSDLKVYKKKSSSSDVLTTLEKGERVPISTRSYGKWSKIKVEVAGKKYYGWVLKNSIKDFRIREVDTNLLTGKKATYHRKKAFGLFTSFSYLSLSEDSFDDASSQKVTVKDAKGSAMFFGFFYDHPFSKTTQVRAYVSLREASLEGKGTYSGSIQTDIDYDQSFLAAGLTIKKYKNDKSNFWYGYGLEVAKANDATVTISNVETEMPSKELPLYVLPHLGLGYDYAMSLKFYLLTEAKLNLAANAEGLLYALDLQAALAYSF